MTDATGTRMAERTKDDVEYLAAITYQHPRSCSVICNVKDGGVSTIMERLSPEDAREIADALKWAYRKGWNDAGGIG